MAIYLLEFSFRIAHSFARLAAVSARGEKDSPSSYNKSLSKIICISFPWKNYEAILFRLLKAVVCG